MRLRLIATLALVAASAAAQTVPRSGAPIGSLRGRVEFRRNVAPAERRPAVSDLSTPAPRDAADRRRAVVYLETAPRAAFDDPEPLRRRMDQRNETFIPSVLAITVGSTVDFPNNDSTYHNVFSLSKPRRFDLGRYAQGRSKSVRFDRPGIVRVFCDIHSHMSAFIIVFNHRYFDTTDAEGRYRIDGIPPGTYSLAAWQDGEKRDAHAVTVPENGTVEHDFVLP